MKHSTGETKLTQKQRAKEVREILALDTDELVKRAKGQLILFPCPENIKYLPKMIKDAGGIEVCYGGIGIHGHVAFNEPGPGVAKSNPRILEINDFTRTIDATRHSGVGGNLENFPRRAITIGMKQCLEARKMLLMTRNETSTFLWANTILRIAALGKPGDDYPVTHARYHKSLRIVSDYGTAQKPKFNI